jgi:transposase InsO family protein
MFRLLRLLFGSFQRFVWSRRDLLLENLVLRQQLVTLQRVNWRPKLSHLDRLFWVAVRRLWSKWKQALVIVNPETVVRWHRTGFRLYWSWLSGHQKAFGRKRISKEVRDLIFRMAAENPTWGAPRIHGELLKLGFDVSERTVSRRVHKAPTNPQPAQRWKTFLENHREAIAAMDFFTVPTLTFGVLYCFFLIAHDRRRILHINVTRHPTGFWITQQLREAFPYDMKHKYLLHDRDAKFGNQVGEAVAALTLKSVRTSFRSPWQNGIAERWVGSCRRELLDHVIALNERHLKRLLSEYVRYYHEHRTHLGLKKDTPCCRPRLSRTKEYRILAFPRVDGLHHRYDVAA